MRRIPTGITGLDNLIEGGFPEGSIVLVSGGSGCGKTIISCQFLWEGLKKEDVCRLITLEQIPKDIKSDALEFGWDFESKEASGTLRVDYINPIGDRGFIERIKNIAEEAGVKRLVIDSISVLLGIYEGDMYKIRDTLYDLIRVLKRTEATTIMTCEIPETKKGALSRFGVEEFVTDGVIVLHYSGVGQASFRSVEVRKMRRTNHTPGAFPFKIIRNKGIILSERLNL